MLRKLENLSVLELADLSAEVSAEHRRRATEVWGVVPSEPTPEPAPNAIAAEMVRRKVVRCYVYCTTDSRTWHCDNSCEEIRSHPRVEHRTVKIIMDAGLLYVGDWLAELKIGPCSLCTHSIWEMVLRQHPGITDLHLAVLGVMLSLLGLITGRAWRSRPRASSGLKAKDVTSAMVPSTTSKRDRTNNIQDRLHESRGRGIELL